MTDTQRDIELEHKYLKIVSHYTLRILLLTSEQKIINLRSV